MQQTVQKYSNTYFVSNRGSFSSILILGFGKRFLSGPLFFPGEAVFFSFFTSTSLKTTQKINQITSYFNSKQFQKQNSQDTLYLQKLT